GLDRRRVEGQDHHFDPEFIHQANTSPVDIENALSHLSPDSIWKKPLRIHQRVVDGEVFLERDFAFHIGPPMPSHHAMAWRVLAAMACAAKSRLEGGCMSCCLPSGQGREGWWSQGESNPRPRECHSRALPTELWPQFATSSAALRMRRKDSALFF